jgi:hypothetical protein
MMLNRKIDTAALLAESFEVVKRTSTVILSKINFETVPVSGSEAEEAIAEVA